MRDAAGDLDRAEDLARKDVAEGRNSKKRPSEQRAVPVLRNVVFVVQDYQALRDGTDKEGRRGDHGHPAENGYPTLDQTPEGWWAKSLRRVESGPAVLGADGGVDRGHFGHGGGDCEVAGPTEKGPVDE